MPATCVAWNDCVGSNGMFAYVVRRRGGRERALHDHLRRRELRLALREARRIREAGRVEVRVGRLEAVVDDPDLHAVAGGREGRRPRACRRRSAPGRLDRRAARGSARSARPSPTPGHVREQRRVCERGQDDGEAVRDEPVAPADLRGRDRRDWMRSRERACAAASSRAIGGVAAPTASDRPNDASGGAFERDDDLGRRDRAARAETVAGENDGGRGRRDEKDDEPLQSADERT